METRTFLLNNVKADQKNMRWPVMDYWADISTFDPLAVMHDNISVL